MNNKKITEKEIKKLEKEIEHKLWEESIVKEAYKLLKENLDLRKALKEKDAEIKKAIDEIPCYPFRNQNTGEVEPFISRGELKQKLGVK